MSLEVYGRLCVLVMPRSASKNATGLERFGPPRSACKVRILGVIFCCSGGLLDQRLGELSGLAVLDGPADDVAAEHVENDVEVVLRPLRRALQLVTSQDHSSFGRSASSSGLA